MQPNENPAPQRDFAANPQDYFKKSDYDTSIAPVVERIEHLEKRIKDKANVVETLKEMFGENGDHNIDPIMKSYFESGRVDLKPAIEKAVHEVDRDWLKSLVKRMGFAAWTLIIALISGGVVAIWMSSH